MPLLKQMVFDSWELLHKVGSLLTRYSKICDWSGACTICHRYCAMLHASLRKWKGCMDLSSINISVVKHSLPSSSRATLRTTTALQSRCCPFLLFSPRYSGETSLNSSVCIEVLRQLIESSLVTTPTSIQDSPHYLIQLLNAVCT